MASSNFNPGAPDKIHKWIERKPLTEAVLWTAREKFYLISSVIQFGTDWKSIAQTVKNAGEPYRPIEWYTPTNCERQFRVVLNNQTNEVKSMEYSEMLKHVYDVFIEEFIRDLKKTHDSYLSKYSTLHGVMNRMKQGNLSRNEVTSLYSQARRNEVEGKQYVEQLRTRQNATLASENSSSGSSEETIKWNAPSAPLLTSLLRSRNTIPTHRNSTPISSQLPSTSTPRTRSGKLLPLSPSTVRTQGTPTLSKLLEAPANPYIPSPPQSAQKNKQNEVIGTDLLNGNNSKKENSLSPILNRVRVDSLIAPGPFSQLNKCELSYSKRQISRSPVSTAKNGSKTSSGVVNLLSDSENEDDMSSTQNIFPKNVFQFGEKKDVVGSPRRNEQRATRSQTRSEESCKVISDNKLSGEINEQEALQQQSEECQMTKSNIVDDDIIDIDQIEVEPLSTIHDDVITPSKVMRLSSMSKIGLKTPADNLLTNKTNSKESNNQILEEVSTNFVLNSSVKNDITDDKNVIVEHSQIDNTNITESLVSADSSAVQDIITLRKDGQCFQSPNNSLTSFDGKLLKQNRIIELKGTNIRCIDNKNDKTILFTSQPIVVVNKIKKSFNIKLPPGIKDKAEDDQVVNYDSKRAVKLLGSTQNLVQLLDDQCTYSDEVIIIDDDVNIDVDDGQKESSKSESQIMSLKAIVDNDNSNVPKNSKSTSFQLEKKTNNDNTLWNVLRKPQHVDMSTKKIVNQDTLSKSETETNSPDINNSLIKEIDIDFDQSTTLPEFCNGGEEIVEMNSFDNEELNPLIECGSTNVSETHQNIVTLDQGELSVSGCDSTIGAFDTFAQITKVTQNASSSKDIKSVNREVKTTKQDRNDLELNESFVRAEANSEQGSGASVSGIPILQGVISDVMSKINSDKVIDFDKLVDSSEISEIVEISSDEEEVIVNESNELKVANKNRIQEYDKKVNIKKLNEDKLQTTKNLETGVKNPNYTTDILSSISVVNNISNEIDKSNKINVKNNNFNIETKCVTKETENVQSKKDKELSEENHKRVGIKSSNEITQIKDVVELRKETDIKTQIDKNKLKLKELINNTKETEKYLSTDFEEREGQHDANKTKSMEVQTVEETKTNEFEAGLVQRIKQEENESSNAFGIIHMENTEIMKSKIRETIPDLVEKSRTIKLNRDKQSQKSRELEVTNLNEYDNQIIKNVDVQRGVEIIKGKDDAVLQKAIKAGMPKSKIPDEIQGKVEARRLKDIEVITIEDTEINEESIKEISETKLIKDDTKKINEGEDKQNSVIEMNKKITKMKETEIVDFASPEVKNVEPKKNVSLLQKDPDIEIKCKNKGSEAIIKQDQGVLTLEEESKITKKLEQALVDSKKVNAKENTKELELKISKLKEPEQPNIAENEVKQNKEAQVITRTRGLKVDDKLKESNFSLQSSVPIRASIVLLEPCMTSIKFNQGNKCNSKYVNSNTCDKDISINSSESANEVGGKSRTRSSLFKQTKVFETKSSSSLNSVDQSDSGTIPKESPGTKTTLDDESPTTSSNSQRKISLSQSDSSSKDLCESVPKKLTASVEILPSPKEESDQYTNNVKQSESNDAFIEHSPQTITDNSDKSGPKKRGRKRRNDVQNDELHQSNSENSIPQYDATAVIINTSSINTVEEPPTKRTKQRVESLDDDISRERRIQKLKMIYEKAIESNKTFLTIEKQIKKTSPESLAVVKDLSYPVRLDDIKNKITSGEILKIADLQVNLLRMSINLNMVNDTVLADDASDNLINELADNAQLSDGPDKEDNELSNVVDDEDSEEEDLELSDTKYDDHNADDLIDFDATLSDCSYNIDFDHESLILNEKEEDSDSDSSSDNNDDSDNYTLKLY